MSDRTQATVTLAGLAMGICALAGIAYFLGWTPWSDATIPDVAGSPARPPQVATTQSGVVLLPGETLVAPPDPVVAVPAPAPAPALPAKRGPSQPSYSKPAEAPKSAPRVPPPAVAQRSQRPAPPPQYSREERRPNAYERSRSVCLNCGVVTGITRRDYDWEIRVRFEDGSRETHRFYDRPRFELGDAVRLEDGRLYPDQSSPLEPR